MSAKKKQKVIPIKPPETDPFSSSIVDEIGKIGNGTIFRNTWEPVKFWPSGSLYLDRVFGGGIPVGRIIHIAGKTDYGKTSIAFITAQSAIRQSKRVLWVDAEKKYDKSYGESIGIYIDGPKRNMMKIEPQYLEEAMDTCKILIMKNAIDYIIFDSIPGLIPKVEFESTSEDNHMMKRARLWAWFSPLMASHLALVESSMLLINQYRDTPDYGRVYPGGHSKDHHCSIMLDLNKPTQIWTTSSGESTANSRPSSASGTNGIILQGKVHKNHVGPSKMKLELELRFKPHLQVAKGAEITKLGREFGVFAKEDGSLLKSANGYHWYQGKNLGYPSEVPENLVEHELLNDAYNEIREAIRMEKYG